MGRALIVIVMPKYKEMLEGEGIGRKVS